MIDKVELRIPNFIHFAGPFNRLFRDLRNDPKGPFHPSQHYMTVGDLRDFGYPAILHMHNVHDKRGNHKLELVETGAMAYSQMRHEIERVFAVNTNRDGLELMRLDLAADIEGVPVSWFERNIQAKWKRFTAGIGTIGEPVEFSEMGSKGIQTFYFGRRPNVIRIYDKVAGRQYRYRQWIARARRRGTPDAEIPTFEQMFGHSESSFILTRVERQMAAGKVPEALSTFDTLRSAPEFDPFTSLIFAGVGRPEPNPDERSSYFLYGHVFTAEDRTAGFSSGQTVGEPAFTAKREPHPRPISRFFLRRWLLHQPPGDLRALSRFCFPATGSVKEAS